MRFNYFDPRPLRSAPPRDRAGEPGKTTGGVDQLRTPVHTAPGSTRVGAEQASDVKTAIDALDTDKLREIARDRPDALRVKDRYGNTPLIALIKRSHADPSGRRTECIDIVSAATAGGNGQYDKLGASAMTYAVLTDNLPVVKKLIDNGAHVHRSAWLMTVGRPQVEMTAVLERGIEAFMRDRKLPGFKPIPNHASASLLWQEVVSDELSQRVANVADHVGAATEAH